MNIRAEHITKEFGEFAALADVSIEFPSGELSVTVRDVREIGFTARVVVSHLDHGELVIELPRRRLAELALGRGDRAVATVRTASLFLDNLSPNQAMS